MLTLGSEVNLPARVRKILKFRIKILKTTLDTKDKKKIWTSPPCHRNSFSNFIKLSER